jgi:hypothetical protein
MDCSVVPEQGLGETTATDWFFKCMLVDDIVLDQMKEFTLPFLFLFGSFRAAAD